MIQDIAERLDNSYRPDAESSAEDTLFVFRDMDVLACEDMSAPFPTAAEVKHDDKSLYLFSIGDRRFFLTLDREASAPEKFSYVNVRQLRRRHDAVRAELFAMFTAFHLYKWYSSNKFCGSCGAPTSPDSKERALRCGKCGAIMYPRIAPAVIVGVTNGDKLLLTKYADRPHKAFALVAGFVEIGETLDAQRRFAKFLKKLPKPVGIFAVNCCEPVIYFEVLVSVYVPSHFARFPFDAVLVELFGKAAYDQLVILLLLSVRLSVVNGAVGGLCIVAQHFHYVYLSALWPLPVVLFIGRHHPYCRPQALPLRDFCADSDLAVGEILFAL